MGIGRYKNGKFELNVSLRYDASADEIRQWEHSFRRASKLLYNATGGQMQFGSVFVANRRAGTDEADSWLRPPDNDASTTTHGAFGSPGIHMSLTDGEKKIPYNVTHEFGHHGLGLGEEYLGLEEGTYQVSKMRCAEDPQSAACIMGVELALTTVGGLQIMPQGDQIDTTGELTVKGLTNEFCTPANHNENAPSFHNKAHDNKACWTVIQDSYPGIQVATDLGGSELPGHEYIDWILVDEVARFSLVLDRSGSMTHEGALEAVQDGAAYWLQETAQDGDRLSIVSFNHEQSVIFPLKLLNTGDELILTALAQAQTDIQAMTAAGQTDVGGAMASAREQIKSPGERAATQVMVLFSDGMHNTGTEPSALLDGLADDGIRVFTIGFSSGADQATLQKIAEKTKGEFHQVGTDDDPQELKDYLIGLANKLRFGSPIVEYLATGSIEYERRVHVEHGSKSIRLVLSHARGVSLTLSLRRPNHSWVDPASDHNLILMDSSRMGYRQYTIKNPDSGEWLVRVDGTPAREDARFSLSVYSENPTLHVAASGHGRLYEVGDTVELLLVVSHPVPVFGLDLPIASVKTPRGRVLEARFSNPRSGGAYRTTFVVREPGSYEVEIDIHNPGDENVPEFRRIRRLQVHVAPLQGRSWLERAWWLRPFLRLWRPAS